MPIHTCHSRQSTGVSGGVAVRRPFVEVSWCDVESGAVWCELKDANAARSVSRRIGVARAFASQTHIARAFNACRITATTSTRRGQLLRRVLNTARRLFAFYSYNDIQI